MVTSLPARLGTCKQLLRSYSVTIVILVVTLLFVRPNTTTASSPPATRSRKATIKHLNKHVDLLNSAIGEEQEIERQNADELCTSNLHAPVTIKYMPEVDNGEQIAIDSTALPILDGCNVNSTCSLSNKNRQQEYAAMKLCLKESASKLQVYGSNHSSKNTTTNADILRLEEQIKQVEEKLRFATRKRLKERQQS